MTKSELARIGTAFLLIALGCVLAGTSVGHPFDDAFLHTFAGLLPPPSTTTVVPLGVAVLLTAMLALVPTFLLPRLSPMGGLLSTLGLIVVVSTVTLALAWGLHLRFPPAGALAALALSYPLHSWHRLQLANDFLDQELQQLNKDIRQSGFGLAAEVPPVRGGDQFFERIRQIQEAARRLRELRNLISQILESMPHGVIALDRLGRVKLANARAHELWSAELDDLPIKEISESTPYQKEIFNPAGHLLLLESSAHAASGEIGRIINLVDIAQLKHLELMRGETLSFLSHDIRAPLVMALQELDAAEITPAKRQWLRDHLARALKLAEEFLQTARADQLMYSQLEELDWGDLVHQAIDQHFSSAQRAGVRLDRDISPDPLWVKGDYSLLLRVVANLVENAIKHSPADQKVLIRLNEGKDYAVLSVNNRGSVIPVQELPRLFQRFSRLDETSATGTGLGLYFVRIVAEKHGGSVEAVSNAAEGTTFSIKLPLVRTI